MCEIARIDVLARRRQAPAPVRRGVGPQQPPVAVDHDGRECAPLAERRRAERGDPAGDAADSHDGDRDGRGSEAQQSHRQPAPSAASDATAGSWRACRSCAVTSPP